MSDGAGAADPISLLKDALVKLAKAWPGADAKSEEEAKVPPEAASVAAWARKKYDGILRWMLAIFGAVGLLIFGSLPFVELKGVEFGRAAPGLFVAGLGLAIIIWATTRGLEPQDASLGELKQTIDRALLRHEGRSFQRVRLFLLPRDRAAYALHNSLQSPEREAHLGPGISNVAQLINRLGALEKQALAADVGWDGGKTNSESSNVSQQDATKEDSQETEQQRALRVLQVLGPAEANQPPSREQWFNSSTSRTAVDELAQTELEAIEKRLAELREQFVLFGGKSDDLGNMIRSEIAAALGQISTLRAAKSSVEHLRQAGTGAALEKARGYYLRHRELLLDESAVSQLRGTFAVVRRWLFFGSLLTLIGGIIYAFALTNPVATAATNTRVLVTAQAESDAWEALEECRSAATGDITDMLALLLESDDGDGLQDGPFLIVTTQPGCEGITVHFKEGEGTYAAAPRAAVAPESQDENELAQALATVTLTANTSPSRNVQSECGIDAAELAQSGLQALITSSDDADARQDGPFSIVVTEPQCPGLVVQVPDGDGAYTVIE